jgi:hypothetical protein
MEQDSESTTSAASRPGAHTHGNKLVFSQWFEAMATKLSPRGKAHENDSNDSERHCSAEQRECAATEGDSSSSISTANVSDTASSSFVSCPQTGESSNSFQSGDLKIHQDHIKESSIPKFLHGNASLSPLNISAVSLSDGTSEGNSPRPNLDPHVDPAIEATIKQRLWSPKAKVKGDDAPPIRKTSLHGLIPRRASLLRFGSDRSGGKDGVPSRKGSLLSILHRKTSNFAPTAEEGQNKDMKPASSPLPSMPARRGSQGSLMNPLGPSPGRKGSQGRLGGTLANAPQRKGSRGGSGGSLSYVPPREGSQGSLSGCESKSSPPSLKRFLGNMSPLSDRVLDHPSRRDYSSTRGLRELSSPSRSSLLSGTPLTYSSVPPSPRSRNLDKGSVESVLVVSGSLTRAVDGEEKNEEEIARRLIEMQKQLDKLF